jgi:dolichol kinase
MLFVLVSYICVFGVLNLAERLTKNKKIPAELGRKAPHVAAATIVALWPIFTNYKVIIIASILHMAAAWYVRQIGYFNHIRSVGRLTHGEFYFASGIIITALMNPPAWAFMIAILHMGYADAMAALVGTAKGRRHKFSIFGQTKSVEGSLAFFVTSVILTGVGMLVVAPAGLGSAWLVTLLVPLTSTMLEMVCIYGLDNILVPVFVASVLSQLA